MSNNPVFWIPVPVILEGKIAHIIPDKKIYEVKLKETASGYSIGGGESLGTISCRISYSPGSRSNYNEGDSVKILTNYLFGGPNMTYGSRSQVHKSYIIGLADKNTMYNFPTVSPLLREPGDMSYLNTLEDAGIVAKASGEVDIITASSLSDIYKPFGHGYYENVKTTYAQNFHRIISHNEPYLSREYFGLFKGKDQDDKMTKMSPKDAHICYKRFVQQTMDPGSWVSTCEGSWNPWVGPNNDNDVIKKGSDILYSKVIHSGTTAIGGTRISIEAGAPGDSFYSFRMDKIISSEKFLAPTQGASPPGAGNLLRLLLSDKGEIDLRAVSDAAPMPIPNLSKFHFQVDEEGNVTFHGKGKIIFSHDTASESLCGIEFDGKGGINIMASGGFKVNGQPVVSAPFIDFVMNNPIHLSMGPSPNTPVAKNPLMVPIILAKSKTPITGDAKSGGWTTIGFNPAAPMVGDFPYADYHSTSAS